MYLAQTLEQRKRNAKFTKDQDARRGKSETEVKKRTKATPKSPISPFWLGKLPPLPAPAPGPLFFSYLPLVASGKEGRTRKPFPYDG
ncbi:hypothetical protein SLS62_000866 [Diatrype stigma]|uniref:Stress-associated endoplasmic reticulum protein n=1 Tax=Diatrype stigma TaxID=117547 RepID=A0AAN9V0L2_9PEZI